MKQGTLPAQRRNRLPLVLASLALLATVAILSPRFLSPPITIPDPLAEGMEPSVRRIIGSARAQVVDDPSSEQAWRRFANLLDAHELNEEAELAYARVLELNPHDLASRYNYALVLEYIGRTEEARAEQERVLAARPQDAPAHHRLGELLAREGRYEEAEAEFRKALKAQPDSQISARGLAIALTSQERSAEAIAILEPLVLEVPNDRGAASSLAKAYQRSGQTLKAAALGELPEEDILSLRDPIRYEVINLKADSQSCVLRSKTLERAQQYQKAIDALLLAAEGAPESAAIPDWIGRNYVRLGKPREAIPYFDRSVALDPSRVNAYYNRGAAYEGSGNSAAAIGDYKRAATLDPEHPLARKRLQALGVRH